MLKNLLLLLTAFFATGHAFAQSARIDFSQAPPNLDTLIPKISAEKNDSARYYLAMSALTISETNPVQDMLNSEKILVYGQKNNDPVCQLLGLACLGYDYREFGNHVKSLDYNLQANKVAEKSKNNRLISFAKAMLALNYLDLGDYAKSVSYNKAAMEAASTYEPDIMTIVFLLDMGTIYFTMGKIDSALIFTQKAYQTGLRSGINYWLAYNYLQFGSIHAKMKTPTLALSYWKLALDEAARINSPKFASTTYSEIANYYYTNNQKDSAILYAKKAISVVQHTAFSTMSIVPSKILLDIYRDNNIDSAFKYSEIYRIAKDSLFNMKAIQQSQLMLFEEDARQQELAVEQYKAVVARKHNLEYALIALGIITFIILFLLLSRRLITNSKVIEFLGVIALLIVFEFFNLLLHPFLESFTNHSPLMMLLGLVFIATLLIPLHHRLEKWATAKLVEKNKQIRLAAAKKTIERLATKSENI
jgi:tetratricopeptide (TPR) repeat protein